MMNRLIASAAGLIGAGALAATLALGAPTPAAAAALAQPPAAALAQQGPGGARQGQIADKLTVAALVRATSEATGLTGREVLEAVKGGQTLAQVAAANGSSGDAVVQSVADKAKARLDRQVQAGRISQARADELLGRLTDKAADLVDDASLGAKVAERQAQIEQRYTAPALVRAAAEATGLPAGDIAGRLRDGESLRAIVESAGGDPQAVLDAATDGFRAAAEQAMDATR